MDDARDHSQILNRLADIELPAPPDWQPLLITSGIITACLLAIVTWLYIRRRKTPHADNKVTGYASPALTAQIKLQQLINNWQSHAISEREAAYQLTTLLRLGMNLPQFTPDCPAHLASEQQAWHETAMICTSLRYQKTSTIRLSLEIFQRAEQWLIKTSQHHGQRI